MSTTFTPAEADYLHASELGRLSTITRDGSPTVVPVGYRLGVCWCEGPPKWWRGATRR